MNSTTNNSERLRRWRLILGSEAGSGEGTGEEGGFSLGAGDRAMDKALAALYGNSKGENSRSERDQAVWAVQRPTSPAG